MRRKPLRAKQTVFVSACVLLLGGFLAAQTLPRVRPAVSFSAAAQTAAGVTPSPTPVLSPPADGTLPTPSSGRREMALYEKAGPFSVTAETAPQGRESVMAQVRGFLLEKWRGRRRGHLAVQLPDAEGRPTPMAFYVEPDDGGRWAVVLETAAGVQKFGFVEEVEIPEDGPLLAPTTEGASPRPGARGLHLKESAESNSGLVL